MSLSKDLVSQFAKLVSSKENKNAETTVYGEVVEDGTNKYVRVDGSDQLIPIEDGTTAVDANIGERVSVSIKDHAATVTGNVSSPAARTGDVQNIGAQVTEIKKDTLLLVTRVEAQEGYIEDLQADMAEIGELKVAAAKIEQLEANDVKITGDLEAANASITNLQTTKLDVEVANAQFATIDNLNANTARINQLETDKASITDLEAVEADIIKLNAEKASVKDLEAVNAEINDLDATFATIDNLEAAEAKIEDLEADNVTINSTLNAHKAVINDLNASYATIDFANIEMAAVEELFTKSGIIKDLVVGDTSVTGELVGVTLKGDLVEAGTLKADRLVVKGSDGNYYALNTDFAAMPGVTPVEEDAIHGSVLIKKSIVAEKIDVKDLVAFDATIGGFKITSDAIHSVAKGSVDNTIEGIYMDSTGQFNVGNSSNFLKFFKDQNGAWKLNVSADTITFGAGKKSVEEAIDEVSESTRVNSEDLTEYMSATTKELESLQGQIDGSIMTWFYEYVPTNDNIPAVEWNTTELKNNHLGDLFYDTITGYCYRWQVQNNEYFWTRITDVDVTKALSDAAKAQTTADGKRRVFVATPTPPYDVGDLWVQGLSGELMRCQTAKTQSQSYAAADWIKATKYTDDTAANTAQADANALKTRVTNAETQISQNRDAIALRATKDEVTKTLGGYYTKTEADAKLEVSAEAVKTEVSKTYATKQEVDDIEIGGRNLLLNSSFKENLDEWQTVGDVLDEQNTVSGTQVVRVDDISDKAPATVQLSSKNLLDLSSIMGKTVTANGGTLSCGADGSITGSGVVTGYMGFDAFNLYLPKGKYILSASGTFSNIACVVVVRDANDTTLKEGGVVLSGGGFSFNTEDYPSYSYITVSIKRNNNVEMSGTAYFQIEKGSTATPYTPYSQTGSLVGHSVTVCGKNILPYPWHFTSPTTTGGLTYTDNGDGSFSVVGDITATNEIYLIRDQLPAGTYTFSLAGEIPRYTSCTVKFYDIEAKKIVKNLGDVTSTKKAVTFTITEEEAKLCSVWINVYSYYNTDRYTYETLNLLLYPQIELGTTATEHEPYKDPRTYTADENGLVTIDTPYSPSMTVIAQNDRLCIDTMTYSIPGGFLEKNGKQCLNIKHDTFGVTKYIYQSVLDKVEANSEYVVSCWVRTEGVTAGTTNPTFSYQLSGNYNADGVQTWWGRGSANFDTFGTADEWQRVVWRFDSNNMPDLNTLLLCLYTRDIIGDVYFCELKLEKGNRATDWTPAPEDTENDIADVKNFVLAETRASLDITEASIISKVEETYVNTDSFDSYKEHASSQVEQTAHDLTVSFNNTTAGINEKLDGEIETREKHFKMSEDGLVISAGDTSVKVVVNNDLICFVKGSTTKENILTNGATIDPDDSKFKSDSGLYIVSTAINAGLGYLMIGFMDGSQCLLKYPTANDVPDIDPGTALIYDKNGPSLTRFGDKLLGYWDGNNFYGGNLMIRVDERAQFGNFAAIPRSNGNLSWLKVR